MNSPLLAAAIVIALATVASRALTRRTDVPYRVFLVVAGDAVVAPTTPWPRRRRGTGPASRTGTGLAPSGRVRVAERPLSSLVEHFS